MLSRVSLFPDLVCSLNKKRLIYCMYPRFMCVGCGKSFSDYYNFFASVFVPNSSRRGDKKLFSVLHFFLLLYSIKLKLIDLDSQKNSKQKIMRVLIVSVVFASK